MLKRKVRKNAKYISHNTSPQPSVRMIMLSLKEKQLLTKGRGLGNNDRYFLFFK